MAARSPERVQSVDRLDAPLVGHLHIEAVVCRLAWRINDFTVSRSAPSATSLVQYQLRSVIRCGLPSVTVRDRPSDWLCVVGAKSRISSS